MTPYEYHNDQLGVQARFLFSGKNAAHDSLNLIGERGLQKRIEKGYLHRLRPNGPNTPMLVAWLTLPPTWQRLLIEAFGEPAKQQGQRWFAKHYQRDTAALAFYLAYRLGDDKPLPDAAIEEYTLNASVLNTVQRVYHNRSGLVRSMKGTPNAMHNPVKGTVTTVWEIVAGECNRFRDIQAHTLPSNPARLRHKLREYKKGSYQALIHGNWCNKSALKVDDQVIALLNAMFADVAEKPTATEVARRYDGFLDGYVEVINHESGELYAPESFPKLSTATVTNYLAKWVNKVGTHTLRSGDRQKWLNRFKPAHQLKQPQYASSILSIDDRQPPFEYAKGKRVWFYNGIDLGSEAITVWVYGTTKEGIIDDFYRQLVRNYAGWGLSIPAELEGEMSLNSKFLDTFLQEGSLFQHVRIEANNARGKRIEAYYGQLRYGIEKSRVGWIARPFATSEPNQAGPKEVPLVPYEDIVAGCKLDIQTWNNMEHSKVKGKTRWEVFMERQHPDLKPINWRAFLPWLGNKTETSCRLGTIRLRGEQYLLGIDGKLAFSDRLIRLMDQIEGQDVDVYWLDGNDGKMLKALVYLRGSDRYVCDAMLKPAYTRARIEQTPEDEAARTDMSKYVASVQGFINQRKREIDRVTVIDNRPRTLNNNFKIDIPVRPSQLMPQYEEAEVLDEPADDDFSVLSNRFQQDLKDRF